MSQGLLLEQAVLCPSALWPSTRCSEWPCWQQGRYQPARLGMALPCQDTLGMACLSPCPARLSSQPRCSPWQCRARTSSRCLSQNSLLCVVAVTRAGTWCGQEPTQTQSLCVWAIVAFFRHFKNSGKKQYQTRFGESVARAAVAHDGGEQE